MFSRLSDFNFFNKGAIAGFFGQGKFLSLTYPNILLKISYKQKFVEMYSLKGKGQVARKGKKHP